jgi:PKD repeat protein
MVSQIVIQIKFYRRNLQMNKANRGKILPHLFFYKRIAFSFMLLFAFTLLTACGGGGGGSAGGGDSASVITGTFIDAPVQGLGYSTATQSGTTNGQGNFRCETGEQITFSIGDVVLGTILCKSIITPLSLVPGAEDETDQTVTNILRLLQSLDDDCDLDNNIHITQQVAAEVDGRPIIFDTGVEDFENGEVADLFDALNGLGVFNCEAPTELRSAEEAQEHFRQVMDGGGVPVELTATFSVTPETLIVFEPVAFDASESTGSITEYSWDFGDGSDGSGVETSHTYSETGTYTVTLTVTNDNNDTASSSEEIVVNVPPNQPPVASFTPNPTAGTAPQLVSFVPTASDPDGTITQYFWDFGDGTSIKGRVAKRTYKEPGTYLVTLTVTDNDDAETVASAEVVIVGPADNLPPTASFIATPETGEATLQVSFNASASSDPDGSIVSYGWNFGDGQTSSGVTKNHSYPEAGTYLVTLTITDNDGATAAATTEIIVSEAVIDCSTNNPCDDNATCDDNGEEIVCTCNEGWTGDGFTCSIVECEGNETLPEGGSACGLNDRGELGLRCVNSTWQDNPDTCIDPDVCTDGSSDGDLGTCGLNGNGTLQQVCLEGQWSESLECDDPDVCTNDDTLTDGGSACGQNDRGELGQICVDGAWQDNPDTCIDPDVCIDDSVTDGSTACGFNDNGTLMQVCVEGQLTDSDDCDDSDVCVNDSTQVGPTPCTDGHYRQLCENGQWSDTTDCVLDGDDDGDLVNAGDDPDDADNTVCGDSDSDGCDDCSVSGIFDPANDGWDENGDGACELPLDYDCMNGANAATDPYRLQACIQFTYVNQDRDLFADESDNAAPLVWNEDIWEVAVAHTIDMCESVFFNHFNLSGDSPSDRAAAAGLPYGLAENIAINQDPGAAQYAFMEEPTCRGHRANVLEPRAIEVGIGYHLCENPDNTEWNGSQFVTQNYRWDFNIAQNAYCQNSVNVCNIPPNPPTTAPCPENLIAWGFCPVPSADTLQGWGCN